MTTAYAAGVKARKEGKAMDDNPYTGPVVRGILRPMDPESHGAWTRGYRDQRDATAKQFPNVSSFRRKQNRYYA